MEALLSWSDIAMIAGAVVLVVLIIVRFRRWPYDRKVDRGWRR